MRAFHKGDMLPKPRFHLVWVPIDHLRMHSDEPTATALVLLTCSIIHQHKEERLLELSNSLKLDNLPCMKV